MKNLFGTLLVISLITASASAQSNKIVFGPLVGDDAGVLTVHNGEAIEIEMWVRTDPNNPAPVVGVAHGLISEDIIIAERNGIIIEPQYDEPYWEQNWLDGPFVHDPDDSFPIPEGWTCEMQVALHCGFGPCDNDEMDTQGEWDLYGTWLMVTNTQIPTEQTYYPFAMGWYPHSGQGTSWSFEAPPGGSTVPEQDYCGLYFPANSAPQFTLCPEGECADSGQPICFALAGQDIDYLDDLHIAQIEGPGIYTEETGGPGGSTSGTWCWDDPVAGSYTLVFELNDNFGGADICEFTLEVGDIALGMDCPVAGFPGGTVVVGLYLSTCLFETGAVELLLGWDPSALALLDVNPLSRIDFGEEYFDVNIDNGGPGTVRITWISDINEGMSHPPAWPGDDPIINLTFHISQDLPFGMNLPISFLTQHYSDNTISDPGGYDWFRPALNDGCVETQDPMALRGDPNMNGWFFEVGDAVLVARRLIYGYDAWSENGTADDDLQEAAADLNGNGMVDVADLILFVNIINGISDPPKLEPVSTIVTVSMSEIIENNIEIALNSAVDIAGVMIKIEHSGVELGVPALNNGMEVRFHAADGFMNVVVYSPDAKTIPAGNSKLFTIPVLSNEGGSVRLAEVSCADSYGRLLQTVSSSEVPPPTIFAVAQNYPNPFNAKTTIKYSLPEENEVTIDIYDILGRKIETLISGIQPPGSHSVVWDAENQPSGVYFYKIKTGEHTESRSCLLLK